MTEISRPWQGTSTGDAGPYSSDNWAAMYRDLFRGNYADSGPILGSGTPPDPGLTIQATSPASASVDVTAGSALVHGTWYNNSATKNLSIAANGSGNPRIDSIVLRKDWSAQTVRLVVKQGTAAVSPTPPALVQTDGTMWEESLGEIAVANGFATLAQSTITPRRVFVNAADGIYLYNILNNSGTTLETGDVVIWDSTANRAVTTTTTQGNNLIAGVWQGRTANGGYGRVLVDGVGYVKTNAAVSARGLVLVTSTTTKQAAICAAADTASKLNSLGLTLETTSASGLALAIIKVRGFDKPARQVIKRDNGATYSVASTSFVDIDSTNLKITLVVHSGTVQLTFTGVTLGSSGDFDLAVDGTRVGTAGINGLSHGDGSDSANTPINMTALITGLSAGSHDFTVMYRAAVGNVNLASGNGVAGQDFIPVFSAIEIP